MWWWSIRVFPFPSHSKCTGNDTLFGNKDIDTLYAGPGQDILDGGKNLTFYYACAKPKDYVLLTADFPDTVQNTIMIIQTVFKDKLELQQRFTAMSARRSCSLFTYAYFYLFPPHLFKVSLKRMLVGCLSFTYPPLGACNFSFPFWAGGFQWEQQWCPRDRRALHRTARANYAADRMLFRRRLRQRKGFFPSRARFLMPYESIISCLNKKGNEKRVRSTCTMCNSKHIESRSDIRLECSCLLNWFHILEVVFLCFFFSNRKRKREAWLEIRYIHIFLFNILWIEPCQNLMSSFPLFFFLLATKQTMSRHHHHHRPRPPHPPAMIFLSSYTLRRLWRALHARAEEKLCTSSLNPIQ